MKLWLMGPSLLLLPGGIVGICVVNDKNKKKKKKKKKKTRLLKKRIGVLFNILTVNKCVLKIQTTVKICYYILKKLSFICVCQRPCKLSFFFFFFFFFFLCVCVLSNVSDL